MAPHSVPPEVAKRIISSSSHDVTLCALARTTRSFQAVAERALYYDVQIIPHANYIPLLHTLKAASRLAHLVRVFHFTSRPRVRDFATLQSVVEIVNTTQFWDLLRLAVQNLGQLELLHLDTEIIAGYRYSLGQTRGQSSLLSPPPPNLQATEIQLSFPWDANMAAFLSTQIDVKYLKIPDLLEDEPLDIMPLGVMPHLTLFEGSLFILEQLYHCPLTRLKFIVSTEEAVSLLPLMLPELYRFKKLVSLSILLLPPDTADASVEMIVNACPNLKHLSVIPYSPTYEAVSQISCTINCTCV
jgi:hypothetical protein